MIPRIDKFAYSFAVTLFCLLFSLYVYYPGWMSPDSFAQYEDARAGLYHDWHPVFMAWWWRLLLNVWEGPQPILLQNLLFYWGGWFLLACWAGRRIGRAAVIVPFIGLWPGLSFPLGQIWKDIFFATPLFFSWALLFYVGDRRDYPSWFHRILLAFSLIIGVGAKPNGIVVLPFILAHWALLECRGWRITFTQLVVPTVGATILVSAVPIGISSMLPVQHSYPFQYTQTYDLLAISVATEKNLLPSYLKMKFGGGIDDVRGLYFVGGNNLMFYNKVGSINTSNENDLLELRHHWIDAIAKHPGVYLRHRLLNFLSLLRFGETAPAVVADPGIMENSYGLRARWTFIGSLLTTSLAALMHEAAGEGWRM